MTWQGRRTAWLLATLAVVLLAVPTAWAQNSVTSADEVVVAEGETHEGNLYAFGDSVRIDGTVTGDVVSAGKTVHIGRQGRVRGDVLAAGYAIQVDGQISGDLRVAAYMVEVDAGSVGGDLAAVGFSHDIGPEGAIGQDVLVGGYQLLLDGAVGGNVHFAGAALDINGTVDGNVDAYVNGSDGEGGPAALPFGMFFGDRELPQPSRTASQGLTVGPDADIGGTLAYTSSVAAELPGGVAGGIAFNEQATDETAAANEPETPLWLAMLRTFLALAILGLLVLWLLPRLLVPASSALRARPGASLGYGLLALVGDIAALVALVVAFVLAMIFAGILHLGGGLAWPATALLVVSAVLLTFGFALALLLGTIAAGNAMGGFLLRNDEAANAPRRVGALLVGLAIVAVLVSLPWGLGFLLGLVLSLLGLGGLVLAWLTGRRTPPQLAPAAYPPLPDAS